MCYVVVVHCWKKTMHMFCAVAGSTCSAQYLMRVVCLMWDGAAAQPVNCCGNCRTVYVPQAAVACQGRPAWVTCIIVFMY